MKPILINGAMDIEVDTLIKELDAKLIKTVAGYEYFSCEYEGYPIILSKTKIGMVNAAASTTIAVNEFSPAVIINQGCFGGYAHLNVRDILLVETTKNITFFRTSKGDEVDIKNWEHIDFENKNLPKADEKLLSVYQNTACDFGKVYTGIMGSGDVWNRETVFIKYLNETLGVLGEDMESHAVGIVARNFDIPFLSVRIVSNNEVLKQEYDRETVILCQEYVIKGLKDVVGYLKK